MGNPLIIERTKILLSSFKLIFFHEHMIDLKNESYSIYTFMMSFLTDIRFLTPDQTCRPGTLCGWTRTASPLWTSTPRSRRRRWPDPAWGRRRTAGFHRCRSYSHRVDLQTEAAAAAQMKVQEHKRTQTLTFIALIQLIQLLAVHCCFHGVSVEEIGALEVVIRGRV